MAGIVVHPRVLKHFDEQNEDEGRRSCARGWCRFRFGGSRAWAFQASIAWHEISGRRFTWENSDEFLCMSIDVPVRAYFDISTTTFHP